MNDEEDGGDEEDEEVHSQLVDPERSRRVNTSPITKLKVEPFTEMNEQPSNKLTDLQPINQCSARQ